jgi:hypothetical protein
MTVAEVLAWFAASEILSTDNVVIIDAAGVSRTIVGFVRIGNEQNILPAGSDTAPYVKITLE